MDTELTTLAGDFPIIADAKDRIQLPAPLRRAIQSDGSERLYGVEGINGNLWLYAEQVYRAIAARRGPPLLEPTLEQNDFDLRYFAEALMLPWDKQGRIVISPATRGVYGLGRDIVMVGVRDHIELFDLPTWTQRLELRKKRSLKKRTELQIRSGVGPVPVGTMSPTAPDGSQGDLTVDR